MSNAATALAAIVLALALSACEGGTSTDTSSTDTSSTDEVTVSVEEQALEEVWEQSGPYEQDQICEAFNAYPEEFTDGFMGEVEDTFDRDMVVEFYEGKCA